VIGLTLVWWVGVCGAEHEVPTRVVLESVGLRVPVGFEVTEFAGPDWASDIQAITEHPRGGIIASGPGYVRWLRDLDGDGRADQRTELVKLPAGAMGLWAESDTLFVCDSSSILRFVDRDDDGIPEPPAEVVFRVASAGEHSLHALRRGPDGWLYGMAGDGAGIDRDRITSRTSPVRDPVGGCLLRWSPDFGRCEVVADGFRNAYDFDFSADGEIWTYDSDNERCVGLPWYEPTRVYQVVAGEHHGWRGGREKNIFRLPPYFPDVAAPVATLGRGSPTGVMTYRHRHFPERYHGGLFVLDWTFGRVVYLRLSPAGSSFRATAEPFLDPVGSAGFAPTDGVIARSTGEMFLSVGGRGTRGGIYRVRFPDRASPLSVSPAVEPTPTDLDRLDGFGLALVRGEGTTPEIGIRRAWERIDRHPDVLDEGTWSKLLREGLTQPDRLVARAAARAERHWRAEHGSGRPIDAELARLAPSLVMLVDAGLSMETLQARLQGVDPTRLQGDELLDLVRAWQKLLGDVGDPTHPAAVDFLYTPRARRNDWPTIPPSIWKSFPSGDARVDRELTRLAAMVELQDADFARQVLVAILDEQDPVQVVHYLIALARLRPPAGCIRVEDLSQGMLMLPLRYTMAKITLDTNGPGRLREIHTLLARQYPGLNDAIIQSDLFGSPGSLIWTHAPGFDRPKGARRLLQEHHHRADELFIEPDRDWVELLGELPLAESRALFESLWENPSLRPAIAEFLAREPIERDFVRLVEVVDPRDPATTARVLDGLDRLSARPDLERTKKLCERLLRVVRDSSAAPIERRLLSLLDRTNPAEPIHETAGWRDWFRGVEPAAWAKIDHSDDRWSDRWADRLKRIEPGLGDVARGEKLFAKFSCAGCHAGARAIGPDLAGVGKRFSREDLFRAVIEPDRTIADRYRGTRFITNDGRIFDGVVVYEAADGLLIQQGNLQTLRLAAEEVESRQPLERSLMPAGLLDSAEDQDLADMEAYLKSL
jgi:putative membrane-bound dehydrogenase-like protein